MNIFTKLSKARMVSEPLALVKRFGRDNSGLAALEFVIVAPFLLAMWLGFYTFVVVEEVSTRVSKAAAVVADIPSQYSELDSASLNQALNAADAMMHEKWRDGLRLRVQGVLITEDLEVEVEWTASRRWENDGNPPTIPTELTSVPGFYVIGTARLSHSPTFKSPRYVPWEDELLDFSHTFHFTPRTSGTIPCDDCPIIQ